MCLYPYSVTVFDVGVALAAVLTTDMNSTSLGVDMVPADMDPTSLCTDVVSAGIDPTSPDTGVVSAGMGSIPSKKRRLVVNTCSVNKTRRCIVFETDGHNATVLYDASVSFRQSEISVCPVPFDEEGHSQPSGTAETAEAFRFVEAAEPAKVVEAAEPADVVKAAEPAGVVETAEPAEAGKVEEVGEAVLPHQHEVVETAEPAETDEVEEVGVETPPKRQCLQQVSSASARASRPAYELSEGLLRAFENLRITSEDASDHFRNILVSMAKLLRFFSQYIERN